MSDASLDVVVLQSGLGSQRAQASPPPFSKIRCRFPSHEWKTKAEPTRPWRVAGEKAVNSGRLRTLVAAFPPVPGDP